MIVRVQMRVRFDPKSALMGDREGIIVRVMTSFCRPSIMGSV